MGAAVFLSPSPILQFFNNAGQPNAGGTILTQVGGVNYPTYQDSGGNTPLPNPIPLNSRGEISNTSGISCQLFLVDGVTYTFTQYDVNGNQINQSQFVGSNAITNASFSAGNLNYVVSSIAALRALMHAGYATAFVTGYYSAHDGGGGAYQYDPSDTTSADNGGTIIVASDGGRWKLQYTQSVSVKQFGATGKGIADDTTSIQNALSWAAANGGGDIYVPPGTYKTTSTLTIGGSFVCLHGAGKSISVIACSSVSIDTLLIGSSSSALQSVYVNGIGFQPSVTKTSGSEIHVNGSNINIYLEDLIVTEGFQGIFLDSNASGASGGGSSYHINNAYIESCTYAGVILGSANGWVQGVWMDECTIAANAHGLLIQNCSALYASRLDIIEQTVDGISVNPYNSGMYAIDLFFNNVQCDSTNGIGWSFNQTNGIVGNVVCVDCWASASHSGPAGLFLGNSNLDGLSWINGQIISNAQHGVEITAGNNINIQSSQVFNNSQSGSGTYHGIVVAANVSGFKLMDNMCCAGGYQRLQGGANPQGWGILIAAGTGGDFWVVGNKCDGNVLGGYSNAATGANQKVNDNTFGAAFSTPAVPASGTTIINPAGRDIRVFISGGTFSSVGVNGNTIGIAGNNCDLILRAGENIGINYTSTPSWTMLDM